MAGGLISIQRIQQAAGVEASLGFSNCAALGGFDRLLLKEVGKLENISAGQVPSVARVLRRLGDLAREYPGLRLSQRRQAIDEINGFLNYLRQVWVEETPSASATSTSTCEVAGRIRDPERIPVENLKGVGAHRGKLLGNLGIHTVGELLSHWPRRHEDRRSLKTLSQVLPGSVETVQVKVASVEEQKPRRGLTITRATVGDGTATGTAVWFNQPFVSRYLRRGAEVVLTGKVRERFRQLELTVQDYEVVGRGDRLNTGRIVPFYPAVAQVSQRFLRSLIFEALKEYAAW